MNRPVQGFVSISKITLADGREISTQQAVDYGWIVAAGKQPSGWDLERHEVPVGENLFVDQGRQCVAYAMGFRAPITDYVISKFAVGTGITAPNVTDVALEAPIDLGGSVTKLVDVVDFVSPFVCRFSFTLASGEANGYVISEMGLYTGSDILVARKVRAVSINKTADFAPTLTWRVRF